MDKKNDQTKAKKEIGKKAKKIKEKIMNKVEDRMENAQTNDLEMDQKTPPIIEEETAEKLPINDIGTDDLVSALKIPMQDAKTDDDPVDVHSAVFDSDPEEEEEEEIENLNDKYLGGDYEETDDVSEDDYDNSFFEDSKLMAEMGVEILDLALQTGAMAIAQDFENPESYKGS